MGICITLLALLLGFTSFGDTSCEAYKQQVVADCDSALSTITMLKYNNNTIYSYAWSGLNGIQDKNDSNVSGAITSFESIMNQSGAMSGGLGSLESSINAIRSVASDLVCTNTSGSCDCSSVLGDINNKLGYINTLVSSIAGSNYSDISGKLTQIINKLSSGGSNNVDLSQIESDLSDIQTYISSSLELLEGVYYYLDNDILDYLDSFKWFVSWNESGSKKFIDLYNLVGTFSHNVTNSSGVLSQGMNSSLFKDYWQNYRQTSGTMRKGIGSILSFWRNSSLPRRSTNSLLSMGFIQEFEYLGSLNNWLYTLDLNDIALSNEVVTGFSSVTNTILNGFSAVTNALNRGFSIFANDSPLRGYADNDYYTYLTNYYISVSVNPSGSASESYTNWFNRMEMLLAALVFKQETAKSNDFTTASTGSMENSLNGGLDQLRSIQENSSSVIQSVDKSSRSLISAMQGWNDQLSAAASLPSTIELVDLSVSSAPATLDGGDSSSRIDLILSGGPLRTLCETTRAITTLCWCFVFLFSAWGLARFMVLKFSGIIKFCYAVFKTALGIG